MENKISFKETLIKIFINPLFIIVNFLLWYETATLCMYGNVKLRLPIIIVSIIIIIIDIIFVFIKRKILKLVISNKIMIVIGILMIIIPIGYYGYRIYYSSIPFNGKLSWYLNDVKNSKTIKLKDDNIYSNDLSDIINNLKEELDMENKLYINGTFNIKFKGDGTITAIDTFLYDKKQSYLISYQGGKDIKVYLNGYVNKEYKKSKLLKPFTNAMSNFDIHSELDDSGKNYEICYYGIKDYGYNYDNKYYLYDKGTIFNIDSGLVKGYAVKLFSNTTEKIYILVGNDILVSNNEASDIEKDEQSDVDVSINEAYEDKEGNKVYMLTKTIGYRLVVLDAAAGSRFYGLEKTTDGNTWIEINSDPFSNEIGVASSIKFTDENNGTIILSNASGELKGTYITNDGGKTFIKQ